MPDAKLTFLSTFSGLGGLDLGMEKAGFSPVGCIEIDDTARRSLAANRPGWQLIAPHDVAEASRIVTPRDLGLRKRELGAIVGGPPCQPFSKAAQWSNVARRGLRDPRSKCLTGFFRLVETFLPQVILIENVQGFSTGRTSAIRRITARLRLINRTLRTRYQLQHWIVDAADYGVPQHRTRAILFASRDGGELLLPPPTHAAEPVTAWEAIGAIQIDPATLPQLGHWGNLLPSIPEGQNYLWHTRRGGGVPLFGYRTRFWSFLLKLAKNRPSWTIPAQPGPYTGPFHWENRALGIWELLRLQSFPIDWIVCGTYRDQVRQIGNATPPLLAEVFGRAIANQFFGKSIPKLPRLAMPRHVLRYPHVEPIHDIPNNFRKLVNDYPDHPGTGRGPKPTSIKRDANGETTTKQPRTDSKRGSERVRPERT